MMRRTWNHITLAFLLLTLSATIGFTSCSQGKAEKTLRSAYYWSTTWQLDSNKMNFIRKHHIERLYVRYFDVVKDADGEIMPNATLHFNTFEEDGNGNKNVSLVPEGIEIIPVVYIVNDCLKTNRKTGKYPEKSDEGDEEAGTLPKKGLENLADKILLRILQMNEANDIKGVKEIQIDCDWTASTQKAYFDFLEKLREKAKAKQIQLSATIRLHQLSMTPPPVDRGILMMYNTGDAKLLECHKPILDMKDVAPYIQHLGSYPLPLAAAYPLFSWRILFREGKFVGIMHADDDFPVLPADSIVVRKPEMTDIMEAVRSINHQNSNINNEVILFDLNTDNIKRFKSEDYEKIFNHRSDGSSI